MLGPVACARQAHRATGPLECPPSVLAGPWRGLRTRALPAGHCPTLPVAVEARRLSAQCPGCSGQVALRIGARAPAGGHSHALGPWDCAVLLDAPRGSSGGLSGQLGAALLDVLSAQITIQKGNKGTEPPPATRVTTSSTLHPHASPDSSSCVRRRLTSLKTLQRRCTRPSCQRGHRDGACTHRRRSPRLHKQTRRRPAQQLPPGAGRGSGDLGVQRLFRVGSQQPKAADPEALPWARIHRLPIPPGPPRAGPHTHVQTLPGETGLPSETRLQTAPCGVRAALPWGTGQALTPLLHRRLMPWGDRPARPGVC